jgi:hypothetical protein
MRFFLMCAVLFSLVLFVFAADSRSPQIDVPKLSTELDRFGARPGTFHFVTNEQTMADAAELKQVFAALDRIDQSVASLDKATRERLLPDLQTVRTFANNVNAHRTSSAGPTAAQAEQRLNDAKGNYMCGACHGHGMMHGHMGGMQGRQ